MRGHEKAKRFWAQFFEGFEEIRVDPAEDPIALGEMVVAPLRWWGGGRERIEVEQAMTDSGPSAMSAQSEVKGFATG